MEKERLSVINTDDFKRKVDMDMVNEVSKKAIEKESNKYHEIPQGDYIIAITNMEVGLTKTGKEALKVEMTISDGEEMDNKLFYTQVLSFDYAKKKAEEFVNALGTDKRVHFHNIEQFTIDVKEVFIKVKDSNEFDIEYKKNDKGYSEYRINGIYDLI